jgi:hypothetical protein
MKIGSLAFVGLFLASQAYASTSINVKSIELIAVDAGAILFRVDAAKSGGPACDTAHRWSIAANTSNGQALAATFLSAYMAGRTITVVGTGACTIWGDSEDVSYIVVAPS